MRYTIGSLAAALLLILAGGGRAASPPVRQYDVVVYGGTSAGMTAAVQAAKMGRSVAIVCPEQRLGGLTSGGLGWTDFGVKAAIGGLAREFYHEVWEHYQDPSAWKEQTKPTYHFGGNDQKQVWWYFEPHVADDIYERWVRDNRIDVFRDQWLDRKNGVKKDGPHIVSITMLDGHVYQAKTFVDATYEGDLMAAAGVSYTVERESTKEYGESMAGVRYSTPSNIDPYVKPGDPTSGLIAGIMPTDTTKTPPGSAHRGVQAYNFRLCMTNDPNNRVPFTKPADYDPSRYELLFRYFAAGHDSLPLKLSPVPNHKTDTNNNGYVSTDYVGASWDYPEASYAERKKIIAAHMTYQTGLLWALGHDPRVPEKVRKEMASWGLAKDEFTHSDNWPHQMYIREARRMVSDYVMTEANCIHEKTAEDSIGLGSYTIDCHGVERVVDSEGKLRFEGGMGRHGIRPYPISYRSIVPKREQCDNLTVPACPSASHVAFASIRMEPVFMVLGQSAGAVAAMAAENNKAVQDLDYAALRKQLLADKQRLDWPPPVDTSQFAGIVVDDSHADLTGRWSTSSAVLPFIGSGYSHDGDDNKGQCKAVFKATIPAAGRYEVRFAYTANKNRADAVKVTIQHAGGKSTVSVNEQKNPPIDGRFVSLGTFEFTPASGAVVTVTNADTKGYVVIDAVQFLPKSPGK